MSGERILIVEDNDQLAQIYCRALALDGYEAEWVSSSAGAVAYLGQHRPDLVMIDFALPDGSGIVLARNLRVLGLKCPFIGMSGARDEIEPMRLLDFTSTFQKPIVLTELLRVVSDAFATVGNRSPKSG
jgi:DNA-binding response OmpR family regulator